MKKLVFSGIACFCIGMGIALINDGATMPFDLHSMTEYSHSYVMGQDTLTLQIADNGNYVGNPSPKQFKEFTKLCAKDSSNFNFDTYMSVIK